MFVASDLLFKRSHWLLHRWGHSKNRLLRRFPAGTGCTTASSTGKCGSIRRGLAQSDLSRTAGIPDGHGRHAGVPADLSLAAGGGRGPRADLDAGPDDPREGMDFNRMSMDRIGGQRRPVVGQSQLLTRCTMCIQRTTSSRPSPMASTCCSAPAPRSAAAASSVTGVSGAFWQCDEGQARRLSAGIVETAEHGVDFAAGDYERMREKLQRADVLVLSHGTKSKAPGTPTTAPSSTSSTCTSPWAAAA